MRFVMVVMTVIIMGSMGMIIMSMGRFMSPALGTEEGHKEQAP